MPAVRITRVSENRDEPTREGQSGPSLRNRLLLWAGVLLAIVVAYYVAAAWLPRW